LRHDEVFVAVVICIDLEYMETASWVALSPLERGDWGVGAALFCTTLFGAGRRKQFLDEPIIHLAVAAPVITSEK
jgi:hypothetical protein